MVSVNLAYWHTYKHAAMKCWSMFTFDFFAPLYHHFYPGNIFFLTGASLPKILAHMHYVRLAYPQLREEVEGLLRGRKLQPAMHVALLDFQFLCEFAIPTVKNTPTPPTSVSFLVHVLRITDCPLVTPITKVHSPHNATHV